MEFDENQTQSAANTLNWINSRISGVQKWTSERARLQNDLERLGADVGEDFSSFHKFQDLMRQQTVEENWWEDANKVEKKIERVEKFLTQIEKLIAQNVAEKVRFEVEQVHSQMAKEKLELTREIAELKKLLVEAKANPTPQQIKTQLEKFSQGDRKLDNFLAKVTDKVVHTVRDLSWKLLRVSETIARSKSEKIHLQAESTHLRAFQCSGDKFRFQSVAEINVIQTDKLLGKMLEENLQQSELLSKVKMNETLGVNSVISSTQKDDNLPEKVDLLGIDSITNSTPSDFTDQCQSEFETFQLIFKKKNALLIKATQGLVAVEQQMLRKKNLNVELKALKSCRESFQTSLLMEKTIGDTFQRFQRLEVENKRLAIELEDLKFERVKLKKEILKFRLENQKFKDAKMVEKKHITIHDEKSIKEQETLRNKIKTQNIRINKITGDLKLLEIKNNSTKEIVKKLKDEKIILQNTIDSINKNLTEKLQTEEILRINYSKAEITIQNIIMENKTLKIDQTNLQHKIETLEKQVEKFTSENFNITQLLCESKVLNDNLEMESTKNTLKIKALTDQLNKSENECENLRKTLENTSSELSSLQIINLKTISSLENLKIDNKTLKNQITTVTNKNNTLNNELKNILHENEGLKSTIKRESKQHDQLKLKSKHKPEKETTNKILSNSEKISKTRNETTDKELMEVKSELTKVKQDIEALQNNVNTGKFNLQNLQAENHALKVELGKLRKEKHQLEELWRGISCRNPESRHRRQKTRGLNSDILIMKKQG